MEKKLKKVKIEPIHVSVEGTHYHIDGKGQNIFFRGEWLEVQADQEGYLYIQPNVGKVIYLDDESQPENN